MHLNAKIRKDVAIGLAKKAIAKHGDSLAARFDAINKQFWESHTAKVEALLPVARSAWPAMIECGLLRCTTQSIIAFSFADEKNISRIGKFSVQTYDLEKSEGCIDHIRTMPEYRFLAKHYQRPYSNAYYYEFRTVAECSVPSLNGMDCFDRDSELSKAIFAVQKDLESVIRAFKKTYSELLDTLNAFKTDKQLLEHLPEAKEFLPIPEPKDTKAVVPVEYVNNLRARIATGVPDQLGGA